MSNINDIIRKLSTYAWIRRVDE